MGETLLRNSQLRVVLVAGVAAGWLDSSCSLEDVVEMGESLMRNSEAVWGTGTAGTPRFQIAAGDVEKAVEEALMQEVERKQPAEAGSGGPGFPGTSSSGGGRGWGPQASSHVQNVF
ncbi:unnamed protein product [Urochloa humidicola]